MGATTLKEFGRFGYFESQWELFKSGHLWKLWYEQYPNLFDDKKLQWAHGQAKYGYQFFEWMGIILLHTATDYLQWEAMNIVYDPKIEKLDSWTRLSL